MTLGSFGDISCIYMDKWVIRGHFYLYMDPMWSLYNIGIGCHEIAQVVFWVELPLQRRLYPIFVKSWVLGKRGLKGVVSDYPTSTNFPRVDGLSTDPGIWGVTGTLLQPTDKIT